MAPTLIRTVPYTLRTKYLDVPRWGFFFLSFLPCRQLGVLTNLPVTYTTNHGRKVVLMRLCEKVEGMEGTLLLVFAEDSSEDTRVWGAFQHLSWGTFPAKNLTGRMAYVTYVTQTIDFDLLYERVLWHWLLLMLQGRKALASRPFPGS